MSVFPSPSSAPQAPVVLPPGVPSPYPDARPGARVFRGRTLDELLPQIRAALGPDAVVVRRREGLRGGALGFFQTRFVEVEAVPGSGDPGVAPGREDGDAWPADAPGPGFDAFDADDAWPEDVAADGVRWLDEEPADAVAPGPAAVSTDGIAPAGGAAFLRHLDAAVERRRAGDGSPVAAPRDAATVTDHGPVTRTSVDDTLPVTAAMPASTPSSATPAMPASTASTTSTTSSATPATPASTTSSATPAAVPTIATWTPARAFQRADATAPRRPIEAPGSGEVEAVAGPASGPLEVRGPVAVAERPDPRRRSPEATFAASIAADLRAAAGPVPAKAGAGGGGPAHPPLVADARPAAPARRTVDADVAEYGLVARGLSPSLARSVVAEAARHGQPLDPGHRIDRATRAALARRIPRTGPREDVRTIVVAGAPGAGRTAAVGALAVAHAGAGRRVLAVALGSPDAGAALAATLVGSDAELLVAGTGAAAAAAIRAEAPDVCLVDPPAVRAADRDAVTALASELRALGPCEVLVAVPGTHATGGVHDVLDALAPLDAGGLVMTHRDRAERPGGVIGASIVRGLPVVYVTDGRAVALADPARLARMVQP